LIKRTTRFGRGERSGRTALGREGLKGVDGRFGA